MKKPELLAPAGDFERLRMAVAYGADAVYLGSRMFSMRSSPDNFTMEQLNEAVEYAHAEGVKIYLTCNTLPHCGELERLPEFLRSASECGVDALIISDLGVFSYAKRYAPDVDIHISTQAGIVNYAAANAFFQLGAKRAVLARELSLGEIAEIRRNTPENLEIEAFVHGAMCVSFSGRCLLSDYLAGRDANRGECAQPCRWTYFLNEEKRPGVYLPVFEDKEGTHIMNSRDLCMIAHIPELVKAGVTSFKIEGRAKSAYYTAVVTNAYRIAIDSFFREGEAWRPPDGLMEEITKVSHRDYCTGFYFGPIQNGQVYKAESYDRNWDVIAVVEKCDSSKAFCRQRNKFCAGDTVEVLEPGKAAFPMIVESIWDESGYKIEKASHPDMKISVKVPAPLKPFTILRKKI